MLYNQRFCLSVRLTVCLSVNNIMKKRIGGFRRNFQHRLEMFRRTIAWIVWQVRLDYSLDPWVCFYFWAAVARMFNSWNYNYRIPREATSRFRFMCNLKTPRYLLKRCTYGQSIFLDQLSYVSSLCKQYPNTNCRQAKMWCHYNSLSFSQRPNNKHPHSSHVTTNC